MNRQQQGAIEYLRVENRILRERLGTSASSSTYRRSDSCQWLSFPTIPSVQTIARIGAMPTAHGSFQSLTAGVVCRVERRRTLLRRLGRRVFKISPPMHPPLMNSGRSCVAMAQAAQVRGHDSPLLYRLDRSRVGRVPIQQQMRTRFVIMHVLKWTAVCQKRTSKLWLFLCHISQQSHYNHPLEVPAICCCERKL